jgi:hypothetical protein
MNTVRACRVVRGRPSALIHTIYFAQPFQRGDAVLVSAARPPISFAVRSADGCAFRLVAGAGTEFGRDAAVDDKINIAFLVVPEWSLRLGAKGLRPVCFSFISLRVQVCLMVVS